MRYRSLLFGLWMVLMPGMAAAFAECDALVQAPRQLAEQARDTAIARAPLKYRDMARDIRLVIDASPAVIMPFASSQQGARFVVVPVEFARLACQMSLATYVTIGGADGRGFVDAAERAGGCVDGGGTLRACLPPFGDRLADHYRETFARLPEGERSLAMVIAQRALWQIVQHEYGHHFLDHDARLGAKEITRIDAEFEADLYAITNGLQAGDPASAMYYVFDGLALIEERTRGLATPDYESGACRAGNVDNITGYVGLVPQLVMDAAGGGRMLLRENSPSILRSALEEHFSPPAPALKPGSCGRIAGAALDETLAELETLALRVEADAQMLFARDEPLDNARATRLLADLVDMSEGFRYADGIATKSIAFMLRGWGLKGRSGTPLMAEVDRMLASERVRGNLQGEDYGRIRAAQGLVMLQERADLPASARMERSVLFLRDAVDHNPALSEAWMNLAFIYFKRGDCASAAELAGRAAATHTGGVESQQGTDFFVSRMRQWSTDPAACRAAAADFHPYPGL